MTPRQWRSKLKLTLSEAAAAVGVKGKNPSRTWQRWEVGERRPPEAVVVAVEKLSEGRVSAASWPAFGERDRRRRIGPRIEPLEARP